MSLTDLQSFLQERIQVFDSTIDVGPGSDADNKIIQPTLRRLGPDPFSVEVRAFIMDRLNQEFPDYATSDGDAITDLLIKPSELLLDPVVRENSRVRNNLSFRDPSTLTLDEADSLGANFFIPRELGDFAGGVVRIYFSAPQSQSINSSNYCTSRSGLSFFPTGSQSISVSEMLFNVEGNLYYFDITVTAEQAGDQYNIDPGEIVAIAGVNSATKVTNKSRFANGLAAEDAPTYIARVGQSITERSLATKRGIVTQLTQAFPGMTRLNVVGFNDPEMERDIIEGNGIGPIIAYGTYGSAVPDGLNGVRTKNFVFNSPDPSWDFTQLIGPPGTDVTGWTLTLHGSWLTTPPISGPPVQDIAVTSVVSPTELQLGVQAIPNGTTDIIWELRQSTLTLSTIPGGILFPNGPNGTVTVPDDQIHIGGCTDIYIRGTVLDQSSLTINVLSDDDPLLSGFEAEGNAGQIVLNDLILGTNYFEYDKTWTALNEAYANNDQLQVLAGVGAGVYRVLSVNQTAGFPPSLTVLPTPVNFSNTRWRLVDEINMDLIEPKETFITGDDLQTINGVASVTTASAVNFLTYGIESGYTLNIESGPDAGEFTIIEVTPFPNYTQLTLNRAPLFTKSNLKYSVFRPASTGTLSVPMIRIDSINLLDSSGQPVGSNIPYAYPIGAFSTQFSHPGSEPKFDIQDAIMGIIGIPLPSGANVSGLSLELLVPDAYSSPVTITFTGANPLSLTTIIQQINTQFTTASGYTGIIALNASGALGIVGNVGPSGSFVQGPATSTAIPALFGYIPNTTPPNTYIPYLSSFMVRAPEFYDNTSYFTEELSPPFDPEYDVLQTLDGAQIGFFTLNSNNGNIGFLFPFPGSPPAGIPPTGLTLPPCIWLNQSLIPQVGRHIQFGSRSFGTARMYFLEPTSVEVNSNTLFTVTLPTGSIIQFLGDPAEKAQILPALPSGTKPTDGASAPAFVGSTLTSASSTFVSDDIQFGDQLVIDYIPITGSVALADPVVNLAFTTFIFSIGGSPNITLTFNRDNLSLPVNNVSRAGVASEINSAAGITIASINSSNELEIVAEAAFVIRASGTANTLLGFSTTTDTNNAAANAGIYTVNTILSETEITYTPQATYTESNEQFSIYRLGVQRIGTTTMNSNVGPTGLFYADVELVSQGTGDIYDITANTLMTVTGLDADGYYLTTSDPNLTFSPAENIEIHFSKTINEVGTDDALSDATTLLGQNIQVNYEYSSLAAQIQNFTLSEQERVVNESPLARHLLPYFVRFDMSYSGGPTPAAVQPTVETLIQALFPDQQLQVSDIQAILTNLSATSITNPVTLFGVIYNLDRTISVEMSQDRINVGRLAAFIPDVINLIQNLT